MLSGSAIREHRTPSSKVSPCPGPDAEIFHRRQGRTYGQRGDDSASPTPIWSWPRGTSTSRTAGTPPSATPTAAGNSPRRPARPRRHPGDPRVHPRQQGQTSRSHRAPPRRLSRLHGTGCARLAEYGGVTSRWASRVRFRAASPDFSPSGAILAGDGPGVVPTSSIVFSSRPRTCRRRWPTTLIWDVSGISDAASGRVGAERVSSHEFLLVGFALVIVLWRRVPDAGLPPTQRPDSRWR